MTKDELLSAVEAKHTEIEQMIATAWPAAFTPAPLPTPAPKPTPKKIDAADIVHSLSADLPFSQQESFMAQAYGIGASIKGSGEQKLTEAGIQGSPLANGDKLRFGKLTAPDGKPAVAFQLAPGDPLTNSSHRSEIQFPGLDIEHEKTYWYAYKVFIYDWGNLQAGDDSFFGAHIHSGDLGIGTGGPHGLVVYGKDGGRTFQVWGAWSMAAAPRNAQSWKSKPIPIPFAQWFEIVGKIKQSQTDGQLQVWMDGVQIANYSGPLGIYTPGFKDYWKFGFYNWSGQKIPKKLLFRSAVFVMDPTGSKYSVNDLRAAVDQK